MSTQYYLNYDTLLDIFLQNECRLPILVRYEYNLCIHGFANKVHCLALSDDAPELPRERPHKYTSFVLVLLSVLLLLLIN